MQVIETGGHNEMCGGYSYTYKVLCDTNTVEDDKQPQQVHG